MKHLFDFLFRFADGERGRFVGRNASTAVFRETSERSYTRACSWKSRDRASWNGKLCSESRYIVLTNTIADAIRPRNLKYYRENVQDAHTFTYFFIPICTGQRLCTGFIHDDIFITIRQGILLSNDIFDSMQRKLYNT